MKRHVESWSVEKLHKTRAKISFPEYQRQPKLWSVEKKQLLIDSILKDIDIPKLYFNKVTGGEFEVVDGQQRLWAIWDFIDDVFPCETAGTRRKYSELSEEDRDTVSGYALQVTVLEDAEDEYLRELFLRLQLGLLLVTGEKLNAAVGKMKEFVFRRLVLKEFVAAVKIPKRRYAKETLCAQIAINSFSRGKLGTFIRTRYEDLLYFFKEYEQPVGNDLAFYEQQSKTITGVLDELNEACGERAVSLTSRSYILSVYLLLEDQRNQIRNVREQQRFGAFVLDLWKSLKREIAAGFERSNRELYEFETMLSSAPGEKYQIERRHTKLLEYYDHFCRTGKIKGEE